MAMNCVVRHIQFRAQHERQQPLRNPAVITVRNKPGERLRIDTHTELPADSELVGRWMISFGAGVQDSQFCASSALSADRP